MNRLLAGALKRKPPRIVEVGLNHIRKKGKTRDYAVFRAQRRNRRIQRVSFGCTGGSRALAYSVANCWFCGYCSVSSRNNFCARASCFSRRAARARIILAKGKSEERRVGKECR